MVGWTKMQKLREGEGDKHVIEECRVILQAEEMKKLELLGPKVRKNVAKLH